MDAKTHCKRASSGNNSASPLPLPQKELSIWNIILSTLMVKCVKAGADVKWLEQGLLTDENFLNHPHPSSPLEKKQQSHQTQKEMREEKETKAKGVEVEEG